MNKEHLVKAVQKYEAGIKDIQAIRIKANATEHQLRNMLDAEIDRFVREIDAPVRISLYKRFLKKLSKLFNFPEDMVS